MVAASGLLFRLHGPGHPHLDVAFGEEKAAWHHADDGERFAIEREVAIKDRGIAIETSLPDRIAQNDDVVLPWFIFFGAERSSQCRLNPENGKDVGADELAIESFRVAGAGEIDVMWTVCTDGFKRVALIAQVKEVCRSNFVLLYPLPERLLPNGNNSFRIFERQWSQQNGINRAEDGRIHADTQRERDEGNSRRTRALQQAAQSVANISDQMVHRFYTS